MTETGGDDAPARAGYVDDAIRRMRVAAAAAGRGGAPGAAGTADPEVLRTALATLSPDDQRLLWATHVQRQEPSAVAEALGTHPRAAARLLPQAEQTLAAALADAHARDCPPACDGTRRALDDLVRRRLAAGQETLLEDHLLECAACLRAFVDVREPAWALRDGGPRLLAGGWLPAAVTAATAQEEASGPASGGSVPRPARRQSWLIVAGTVACVAVAAIAIAIGSGDVAPAAPDPGASSGSTTVGTAPGGAPTPVAPPTSSPRGEGGPSAGPTPSGDSSTAPSDEPSPTASTSDEPASSDPSTSPTSTTTRDDGPTSSSTATSGPRPSTSSTPRPSSSATPPVQEEPPPEETEEPPGETEEPLPETSEPPEETPGPSPTATSTTEPTQ
ncbi:hypothetical protein M1843_09420 [Isoptericola sp. 4D.3]|uniref:Zinc-finger domain-containing protein n=1 Tax=Isoptericola peretonis TaxID=2918523 RepID=A0ABT0J3C4_9MICO|nr:hypothetical protein [Isoptericola sp. 4D.3]